MQKAHLEILFHLLLMGLVLMQDGFSSIKRKRWFIHLPMAIAEQVYNANAVTANQTNPFNDGSQIAQYEFEDNADNSQPNGYIGKGGTFNGSSSNISIGTELIPATNNFTLSFWIYRNTSIEIDLFNQATSSGNIRTYFKLYANGTLGVYSAGTDGSRIQVPATTSTVSNNQWEHIAIVRGGSNMTFYINGAGETETISGGTVGVGRGDLAIISNNALNGKLDQVRTYNTALNPNDVWLLYSETSATSSTLDYPASKGAIALYELEGDATSTSSSTYDGAATNVAWVPLYDGTPTSMQYSAPSVSTPFLKAGDFNGSSYIDTNISTITSNGGSVSLWVKTTTGTQSAFFGGQSPSQNRFYFGVRNNNFWIGAGSAQNSYNISASSLLDGNWHHVVLTLDGSTAKYYLDGNSTPVDTLSYTAAGTIGVTPLIGAIDALGAVSAYTNGSIDQVRIFDRALDAGEVTQLYNEPNN